jgi:hypothetical protein
VNSIKVRTEKKENHETTTEENMIAPTHRSVSEKKKGNESVVGMEMAANDNRKKERKSW